MGGDLIINGELRFDDPLIRLTVTNTSDAVDIGFYGHYIDSGITRFSGLFRDATNKEFRLFRDLEIDPGITNVVEILGASYTKADLILKKIYT